MFFKIFKTKKSSLKNVSSELSLLFIIALPLLVAYLSSSLFSVDFISSEQYGIDGILFYLATFAVVFMFTGFRNKVMNFKPNEFVRNALLYFGIGATVNVVCYSLSHLIDSFFILSLPVYISFGYFAVAGNIFIALGLCDLFYALSTKFKFKSWIVLLLGFVLSAVATAALFDTGNYIFNQLIGYFAPSLAQALCPFICCFVFSTLGYCFASAYAYINKINRFYIFVLIVSFVILLVISLIYIFAEGQVNDFITEKIYSTAYSFSQDMFWVDIFMTLFIIPVIFACLAILHFFINIIDLKDNLFINKTTKNYMLIIVFSLVALTVLSLILGFLNFDIEYDATLLIISIVAFIVLSLLINKSIENKNWVYRLSNIIVKNYVKFFAITWILAVVMFVISYLLTPSSLVDVAGYWM